MYMGDGLMYKYVGKGWYKNVYVLHFTHVLFFTVDLLCYILFAKDTFNLSTEMSESKSASIDSY
jgi:hypothetical protein